MRNGVRCVNSLCRWFKCYGRPRVYEFEAEIFLLCRVASLNFWNAELSTDSQPLEPFITFLCEIAPVLTVESPTSIAQLFWTIDLQTRQQQFN